MLIETEIDGRRARLLFKVHEPEVGKPILATLRGVRWQGREGGDVIPQDDPALVTVLDRLDRCYLIFRSGEFAGKAVIGASEVEYGEQLAGVQSPEKEWFEDEERRKAEGWKS